MFTEYKVRVYSNRTEWRNEQGLLHRADGPAREWTDGSKSWYLNGQKHRTDGPAYEEASGTKEWYLNGQSLSEKEFEAKTKAAPCAGKVVEIDGKKYKIVEIK